MDIFIGTFGKAFGVNGGFVAGSPSSSRRSGRRRTPTSTPTRSARLTRAAAVRAVDIADGPEGRARLANLKARTDPVPGRSRGLGFESIPGPHPVVPLLVRDTDRVRRLVAALFDRGILAVGLTYPVVPRGDETIRFQINAAHTAADIDEVLDALEAHA